MVLPRLKGATGGRHHFLLTDKQVLAGLSQPAPAGACVERFHLFNEAHAQPGTGEISAEITGPFAVGVHAVHRAPDEDRGLALAETGLEQLCGAFNGAERIGLVLTRNVWCRSVDLARTGLTVCASEAEPRSPIEPGSMEASSDRMSPNMFSVSTTSKSRGARGTCMAAASTYM